MSFLIDCRAKGYAWALNQERHSDYNLRASHDAFWHQCIKGTELEDEIPGEANTVMAWQAWEQGVDDSRMFLRDDSMLGTAEIVERTGFDISYIKAELKAKRLRGMKVGNSYAVYPDDFREWFNNPKRGSRSKKDE